MTVIPDLVTHIYDRGRGPFRNICDLPVAEAQAVLDAIGASGHRRIKPDYLRRRLATEDWLISECERLHGKTRLDRPVYFFLGDFTDGLDPSRPDSITLPLTAFSETSLTFTYPDSMTSYDIATRDDHAPYRKAHHGRVFSLHDIRAAIAEFGMPGERWKTEPSMRFDRFVEVQVWDDRPLHHHLRGAKDAGKHAG